MRDSTPARTVLAQGRRVLLFPFLVGIAVLVLLPYLLYGLVLQLAIWLLWCPRQKFILFVYSDSPTWKEYIETNILPSLQNYAIVLNWSEREKWQSAFSLPTMAFRYFGGYREFNPLAVVFRPLRWTRVFRFWQPFKDFKHGKKDSLRKVEDDLSRVVASLAEKPSVRS